MKEIILPAPAKINLSLDITGLLEDGYHQLEMIMQSISLSDKIKLEKSNSGITINCSDDRLPENENNLAYQAAKLFFEENNISSGVKVFIEKNIPLSAGLAGGSTDAAAVLNGLNKLFKAELTADQLRELGSYLGSDVPFCIEGGTVYATGRGDSLKQLPDLEKTHLVLVNPPVEVSTPEAYRKYDQCQPNINIPTRKLTQMIINKDIDWSADWNNVLEPVTEKMVARIKIIKEKLKEFSVKHVLMSGSGPSVYAVVDNKKKAELIVKKWPNEKDFICYCSTLKKGYPNFVLGGVNNEG